MGTDGRAGPSHGGTPAVARLGARLQSGHPLQKLCLVDDDRPGHLDGRLRVCAAVPHAGGRHGASDPDPQRGQGRVHWQARRLAKHEAGHPPRHALHRLRLVTRRCGGRSPWVGCHLRPHAATRRQPGARGGRTGHAHLHIRHHRHAQRRDAHLWQLCVGVCHRHQARAHGR